MEQAGLSFVPSLLVPSLSRDLPADVEHGAWKAGFSLDTLEMWSASTCFNQVVCGVA